MKFLMQNLKIISDSNAIISRRLAFQILSYVNVTRLKIKAGVLISSRCIQIGKAG
jgi:hypothetical protein